MIEKLKNNQQSKKTQSKKPIRKLSKENIFTLVASIILIIAHVAILFAIITSFRYYAIYPSIFGGIVAIIACFLIIVDILFFVGFNHKDTVLKVISCVLVVFLTIGGVCGSILVAKANNIVDNVLDGGNKKYETFSGKLVCYNKYNNFTKIEDLDGKKVGFLVETSNGISYIAKELLNDTDIDYGTIEYKTNAEMIQALLDGSIDAMAITSAYRDIYSLERDENSPFAKYLDNLVDFCDFEKELKIDSNRKVKNLSTDPFNVLLIGYSRTEIGSSVGLADSIILATINPQTYEVSMMSIARDSFVPITCYGGEYDKINSGRSTSRQCFIETVENFLDMEIDYYMELDYLGLVDIVNTIDGVEINNPVSFELDGIYVPAGKFKADGQQALQFCRERHHMPNGDFDRQQHQKEVIIAIARKFIEAGDVSLALHAMEEASMWMSTDLTLSQLTTVFNLLLNTKNYTSLDTFDLVDFQTLRMTGSGGIKYYSYSMRLPLWVYLIYKGSYDESLKHIDEVMGNYTTYNQQYDFGFSLNKKYERPALYSLTYPEVFMYEPDPMPAYWPYLDGLTVAEAMEWASANGVTLSIDTISAGDPRYDASLEGLVVEQDPRHGALISEYKSGTITVMGSAEIDESKSVPLFVGHSYSRVIEWANEYGISYDIDFDTDASGSVGDVVSQSINPGTSIEVAREKGISVVVKAGTYTITFDKNGHEVTVPSQITVTTGDSATSFGGVSPSTIEDGGDNYEFIGWFTAADGGTQVNNSLEVSGDTILYAHWKKICIHTWESGGDENGWIIDVNPTCTAAGSKHRTCTKCGETETQEISALGHDMQPVESSRVEPYCDGENPVDGSQGYKCSRCDHETTEPVPYSGSCTIPEPPETEPEG